MSPDLLSRITIEPGKCGREKGSWQRKRVISLFYKLAYDPFFEAKLAYDPFFDPFFEAPFFEAIDHVDSNDVVITFHKHKGPGSSQIGGWIALR